MDEGEVQFYTILHELGHSLGLTHPDTNPSIDNIKYTMMSDQPLAGMLDGAGFVLPSGLQLLDIAAIQAIYGENTTTRNEDIDGDPNTTGTFYGINKGFGAAANDAFIYTIWDAGGSTDTIDVIGYSDGVKIDLREGQFSSIGKAADANYVGSRGVGLADDNVAIAYGTEIENAIGTSWDDSFTGNNLNNTFFGGFGNDTYFYSLGGGNDTIFDSAGTLDRIIFDAAIGVDNLDLSQSGNDLIIDITAPGGGQIRVQDQFLAGSQIENMNLGSGGAVLTGTDIEDSLTGTAFGDLIEGFDGDDTLYGLAGNDILYGGAGDDRLFGKGGGLLPEDTFEKDILYGGIGNDMLRVGSGGFIPNRVGETKNKSGQWAHVE